MDKTYLVPTSDDFCMSHSINIGIVQAMTKGIVRCANFMAACPWFLEGVALVKKHKLPLGVHLTMTSEWDHIRWGPITPAPSLRDSTGNFFTNFADLAKQAKEREIYEEYKAQITRVLSTGIKPTHLDTHMMGIAEGPPWAMFYPIIKRVCKEYGLIYTYEMKNGSLVHFSDRYGVSLKNEASFIKWLNGLTPGFYQATGHAAVDGDELHAMSSPRHGAREWITTRPRDLAIFTSAKVKATLKKKKIQLITIPQLLKLRYG
jgi:predicted glycoside hydrolase/deacetylase ChbG (UPF0249 family)